MLEESALRILKACWSHHCLNVASFLWRCEAHRHGDIKSAYCYALLVSTAGEVYLESWKRGDDQLCQLWCCSWWFFNCSTHVSPGSVVQICSNLIGRQALRAATHGVDTSHRIPPASTILFTQVVFCFTSLHFRVACAKLLKQWVATCATFVARAKNHPRSQKAMEVWTSTLPPSKT